MAGRPTKYTEKIASDICARMVGGESVRAICKDESLPCKATVMLWVSEDRDGFSDRYAKAFRARMVNHADELLDIADDGTNDYMESNDPDNPGYRVNGEVVARSRLRVDTRKWLISKIVPSFSDKPEKEDNDNTELINAMIAIAGKLPS